MESKTNAKSIKDHQANVEKTCCCQKSEEWTRVISATKSTFIRSKAELEAFDFSDVLPELTAAAIEEFKSSVLFFSREMNFEGQNQTHTPHIEKGVLTFSTANIPTKRLMDIAAIFGIQPEDFSGVRNLRWVTSPRPRCTPCCNWVCTH